MQKRWYRWPSPLRLYLTQVWPAKITESCYASELSQLTVRLWLHPLCSSCARSYWQIEGIPSLMCTSLSSGWEKSRMIGEKLICVKFSGDWGNAFCFENLLQQTIVNECSAKLFLLLAPRWAASPQAFGRMISGDRFLSDSPLPILFFRIRSIVHFLACAS